MTTTILLPRKAAWIYNYPDEMQNIYWMIDRLGEALGIHRLNYDDKNGKVEN